MMMDSDCALTLKLGFDGSLHKGLMRTVVDQEEIFKNQIFSSESVWNQCRIEHSDTLKHQQLSLELELASSHYYTNGIGDHLSLRITPEASGLMKHRVYDDKYSLNTVLKLSLGADAGSQRTSSGRKTCDEEIIRSPLERSSYGKDLFPLTTHCGAKNEFKMSCSIRCRWSDAFNWISEPQSLAVGSENFLEREHLYEGVAFDESFFHEQSHADLSSKNIPSRRKPEVGELDLNKALPDETSINPIDPRAFNLSQSDSSGLSHNEIADHGQATSFNVLEQQETTASTVITSPSKDPSENGECGVSLWEKTSQRISMSKVDFDQKENKLHAYNSSQELLEGADSNRSPVSCKSDCNTDDASSIIKRGCRDVDICDSNETKSLSFGSEVDKTVRKGAVSLIHFSSSPQNLDCGPVSMKRNNCAERETPQSSLESYESIVLKQVDSSVDDYCVSSTPPVATGLDMKDCGVKLKRGRRMKDFRKEILPGLASLSRQEISEDIKIMELALRSREYKKYSSKTARRSDCISSVRSRMPRPRRGGRRYCS